MLNIVRNEEIRHFLNAKRQIYVVQQFSAIS